ncbi:hypothetical protein [Nostoc sp.]
MPNAQCPMPNAQCPMPNAQCPIDLSGNENFIWLKPSSGEGFRGSCFI